MGVVYNQAIKHHVRQGLAFELPMAEMHRLPYKNSPHTSNSFVYRASNDHILKVVEGVKCRFSQRKLKRSILNSATTLRNTFSIWCRFPFGGNLDNFVSVAFLIWASAGRGFRRSSCLLYSSPLHFFFNRRPKINLQKRKKKRLTQPEMAKTHPTQVNN